MCQFATEAVPTLTATLSHVDQRLLSSVFLEDWHYMGCHICLSRNAEELLCSMQRAPYSVTDPLEGILEEGQ